MDSFCRIMTDSSENLPFFAPAGSSAFLHSHHGQFIDLRYLASLCQIDYNWRISTLPSFIRDAHAGVSRQTFWSVASAFRLSQDQFSLGQAASFRYRFCVGGVITCRGTGRTITMIDIAVNNYSFHGFSIGRIEKLFK